MPTSIEYTVHLSLYHREYKDAFQKLCETLSVEDLALVKEFTIARDWFVFNPTFGDDYTLKVGEFMPRSK